MTMDAGRARTTTAAVYAGLQVFSLAFIPSGTFRPMKHTSQTLRKIAVENSEYLH
jgi:hypothetical protein